MTNPVICTVDVVLLTLQNGALHVALLKRDKEPFADTYALPGGYIHAQEDKDARDAAVRVLRDKTGIRSPYLEQLATFSGVARDPRGWSVSICYYALVSEEVFSIARLSTVKLMAVDDLKTYLPFDHREMIESAVERLRSKSTYSSLPVYLCGAEFTLPRLQAVYEAVLGEPINKVSFRRKMDELGIIEPIEGAFEQGVPNRPAQLYQLKKGFKNVLSLTERGLNTG